MGDAVKFYLYKFQDDYETMELSFGFDEYQMSLHGVYICIEDLLKALYEKYNKNISKDSTLLMLVNELNLNLSKKDIKILEYLEDFKKFHKDIYQIKLSKDETKAKIEEAKVVINLLYDLI